MKLLLFTAFVCFTAGTPFQQRLSPAVNRADLESTLIERALSIAPKDSQLLGYRSEADGPVTDQDLINSLPSNATLIRKNIVGGFSCENKVYGYYADVNNDCQIFHLCFNLGQIFPLHYSKNAYYMFSFICPEFTIFTQDAMVCAFVSEAVPCELAEQLYHLNENFFKEDEKGDIRKLNSTTSSTAVP